MINLFDFFFDFCVQNAQIVSFLSTKKNDANIDSIAYEDNSKYDW